MRLLLHRKHFSSLVDPLSVPCQHFFLPDGQNTNRRETPMNAAIVRSGVRWRARMALGAASALLLAFSLPQAHAAPKTLEAGVLNVGLNGDMPMTSVKDGKLIGSDGEIMNLVAERDRK